LQRNQLPVACCTSTNRNHTTTPIDQLRWLDSVEHPVFADTIVERSAPPRRCGSLFPLIPNAIANDFDKA
jgi:hypothetical protein